MAWEVVFENAVLKVETACAHPHFEARLLLLGDPAHYVGGVRSEYRTEIACANARGLLDLIDHLIVDRTGGSYVPRARWEETLTYGDTSGTQVFEYEELPEEDPEGDYQVTLTGRIVETANPGTVLAEHVTRFKTTRATLVAIADAVARKIRLCCVAEVGMRPPREREHRV